MLQADWHLLEHLEVPYRDLYSSEIYQKKCEKKIKKIKKMARKSNCMAALKDRRFRNEVTRIRNLYQNDGGRGLLCELIGKVQIFFLCKIQSLTF